jgi:hypothetical protein
MRNPFLSRRDWPLAAAGVAAGLLTAVLLIYLFLAGMRGNGIDAALLDPELRRPALLDPGAPLPDGPGRGIVGRRETGIESRLAARTLPTRPLRGSLAITMREVVWMEDASVRFARAEFVSARLDLAALGRGDAVLDGVIIRRPVVALRQPVPGAEWNFEHVLAELLADAPLPPVAPRRIIEARNVQILDGTVEVGMPDRRFAFAALQARLPVVVFSRPGLAEPWLRVARLTAQFTQPEPEARLAVAMADGLFRFPNGTVQFDVAEATLDRTRLAAVRGVWDPADPGYGVTAAGRALEVWFADFAFMLPDGFPDTGTAAFAFEVRPLPGDLTEATLTELDAQSGASRAAGSLTIRFGEDHAALLAADLQLDPLELALVEGFTGPLPYDGTLIGRVHGTGGDIAFDLRARLAAPGVPAFTADLTGGVLLADDAVTLQRLAVDLSRVPLAALRAMVPGLPLEGLVTGRISLRGLPGEAPLALDMRLELGFGIALMEGVIDLTGPVPRYDLNGRLIGVELQAVLAPAVPPVALTASFELRGTGTAPELMDASVRLSGQFTGWQAVPGDTLQLAADVRRGTVSVQTMVAALATARLSASGTWRFVEPQQGAVAYDLGVTSLRPFGPYLPLVGDTIAAGSLQAAGTVTGSLTRPTLAGRAAATDVRVGDWQAASLVADYEMTAGGDGLPVAVVDARVRGLSTPTAGTFTEASLVLSMTPPLLSFELAGERADGGVVEIVASGTVPEVGPREILVHRARVDLDGGSWLLAEPATIRWIGGEVYVERLALDDTASGASMALDGQILPLPDLNLRLQAVALPVGDVQRLAGLTPVLEGRLWVDGTVRGAAPEPLAELAFRLEEGVVADIPVRSMAGRVAYVNQETVVEASILVEDDGQLELRLRLPSVLQLAADPVFALIDGVPLSGSLVAEQFPLRVITALLPVEVRDVTGALDARVGLAGTADAPVVEGAATLAGGAITVVDLNQRYEEVTADVAFDGRRLLIRDVRARSDGWVVVAGQVLMERLDEPVLDVNVVFDRFRPMGVDGQRDAALFGTLTLTGPVPGLELAGAVRVDDGYVVIPQFGGPGADLIDITRPPPVLGLPIEPVADDGVWQNLTIRNLRVTAGDAAWFAAEEARAQLAGTLTVDKVGPDLRMVGTLTGTRGQYTLIAGPIVRRFDVVAAQVRFLGESPPNPAIDITARRIVFDPGGRQLPVDVRITGSLQMPRLAVAGVEGIAESELLSFLLFGQPSFALGGEFVPGEEILEQTFLGGFAELAAIELERGFAGLGLDVFQIRLGPGPLGGLGSPTIIMGRRLQEDVFLTMETSIGALFGGGASGESPLRTWAVRLDWTFDPRSQLRLAWEPVYAGRALRGAAVALPLTQQQQQLLVELRRRWTY